MTQSLTLNCKSSPPPEIFDFGLTCPASCTGPMRSSKQLHDSTLSWRARTCSARTGQCPLKIASCDRARKPPRHRPLSANHIVTGKHRYTRGITQPPRRPPARNFSQEFGEQYGNGVPASIRNAWSQLAAWAIGPTQSLQSNKNKGHGLHSFHRASKAEKFNPFFPSCKEKRTDCRSGSKGPMRSSAGAWANRSFDPKRPFAGVLGRFFPSIEGMILRMSLSWTQ